MRFFETAPLPEIARIVKNWKLPSRIRLLAASFLHKRAPELNGGAWILLGQKRGFTADECRDIKDAMKYGSLIISYGNGNQMTTRQPAPIS